MTEMIPIATSDDTVLDARSSLDDPAVSLGFSDSESLRVSEAYIHKIPLELLLDIFELYITAVGNDCQIPPCRDVGTHTPCGPWLLSGVCHHWRAVSLSSPQLWTNVRLVFRSLRKSRRRKRRQTPASSAVALSLQLTRSQNLPLSIYMEWPGNYQTVQHEHEFFAQILNHHRRWKTLELADNSESSILYDTLRAIRSHSGPFVCPVLEKLVMNHHSIYLVTTEPSAQSALFTLESLPALRSLIIQCKDFQNFVLHATFLWSQLEILSIRNMENLHHLFRGTELNLNNLTVLELIHCDPPDSVEDFQTLIPSLKAIHLIGTSSKIFSLFITPALENIVTDEVSFWAVRFICPLIDRSQCSIRTLRCHIGRSLPGLEASLPLLEKMNMLEHLSVDVDGFTDPPLDVHWFSEWLSNMDKNPLGYCPRLRRFSLSGRCLSTLPYDGPPPQDLSLVLNVLEMRMAFARSAENLFLGLQCVELFYGLGWRMESGIADQISGLRNAGLDVVLRPLEDMPDLFYTRRR